MLEIWTHLSIKLNCWRFSKISTLLLSKAKLFMILTPNNREDMVLSNLPTKHRHKKPSANAMGNNSVGELSKFPMPTWKIKSKIKMKMISMRPKQDRWSKYINSTTQWWMTQFWRLLMRNKWNKALVQNQIRKKEFGKVWRIWDHWTMSRQKTHRNIYKHCQDGWQMNLRRKLRHKYFAVDVDSV